MFLFDFLDVFFLLHYLILSSYGKSFWSFVYVNIYCVGAEISILMSLLDGPDPYFYCRMMEKTPSVKEEMDGMAFISRQSRHICFVIIMIKVLFPTLSICTLTWRVNNYVSRQGKGINRRNESIKKARSLISLRLSVDCTEYCNSS